MEKKCTCGSTAFTETAQRDGVPKALRGKPQEPQQKHRWFTCDECGNGYRENIPPDDRYRLYAKKEAV